MYYNLAPLYDSIDATREAVRSSLAKVIPVGANKTALDIGCGTGSSSLMLKDKGYSVTGIDLSQPMLDLAKEKDSNINWIQGNIISHPFKTKFDLILCANNIPNHFHLFSDLSQFFYKVNALLPKSGIFIFDIPTLTAIQQLPPEVKLHGIEVKNVWSPQEAAILQITSKDGQMDKNYLKYWDVFTAYSLLRRCEWESIDIKYGRFSNIFIAVR